MKILPQELEERAHFFQQVFIEFKHWMQKLQYFELGLKLWEDTFGSLRG